MRALFYHSSPAWTGSSRVFLSAALGLRERRWEICVACPGGSAVERRAADAGLSVAPVAQSGWILEAWLLRRIIRERFTEAVFVHDTREHLVAASAMRMAERGAIVRRVRTGGRIRPGLASRVSARLATTGYLFSSPEDLARAAPLPERSLKPHVADLGMDAAQYDLVEPQPLRMYDANERMIVCVCDRASHSRVAGVMRAVSMLRPQHPELRLALVGAGSEAEAIRIHAAALGISRIVRQLGNLQDRIPLLRSAALGWVASDGDDGAWGALDLMASRVPVLGERDSVVRRYIADGISGVLLPVCDPAVSAARIASLLAHDQERSAIGNAGYSRVSREFTHENMVKGFEMAAVAARDRTAWRLR